MNGDPGPISHSSIQPLAGTAEMVHRIASIEAEYATLRARVLALETRVGEPASEDPERDATGLMLVAEIVGRDATDHPPRTASGLVKSMAEVHALLVEVRDAQKRDEEARRADVARVEPYKSDARSVLRYVLGALVLAAIYYAAGRVSITLRP